MKNIIKISLALFLLITVFSTLQANCNYENMDMVVRQVSYGDQPCYQLDMYYPGENRPSFHSTVFCHDQQACTFYPLTNFDVDYGLGCNWVTYTCVVTVEGLLASGCGGNGPSGM